MSSKHPSGFQGTNSKLALLEAQYQKVLERPASNPRVHALSLCSLKQMINQLKEELVVYKAHATVGRDA